MAQTYLHRFPELKGFLDDIEERFLRSQLPPSKIILDDTDVMRMLKISKRKLAELRAKREIRFHPTGKSSTQKNNFSKAGTATTKGRRAGKIYYTLDGVLEYIQRTTVKSILEKTKI